MEVNNLSSDDDDRKQPAAAAANPNPADDDYTEPPLPHGEYSDEEDEYDDEETPHPPPSGDNNGIQLEKSFLRNNATDTTLSNTMSTLIKAVHAAAGKPMIDDNCFLIPIDCGDEDLSFRNNMKIDSIRLKDKSTSVVYYIYSKKKNKKRKRSSSIGSSSSNGSSSSIGSSSSNNNDEISDLEQKGIGRKTGRATNGKGRYQWYIDKGKVDEDDEECIVIFDYDYAEDKVINTYLPNAFDALGSKDEVKLPSITKDLTMTQVEDDIETDGHLSFFPSLLLDSFLNKSPESPVDGAKKTQGTERAIGLNTAEDIMQYTLNETGETAQHEHLQFGYTKDTIKPWNKEVQTSCNTFKDKLLDEVGGRDWFDNINILNGKSIWSSWPPDILHNIVAATCISYDEMIGEQGTKDRYWKDVTDIKCNADGKPYAAQEFYTAEHRKDIRAVHIDAVLTNKNNEDGDLMIINECSIGYKKAPGEIVKADDKRAESLKALVSGQGYRKFHEYCGCTAWVNKEKGKASVIIIHPPFCVVLFSGQDSNEAGKWSVIKRQALRAKMAHFMQAVFQYFIGQGKESIKTRQLVFGNFLYAFMMRIYLLKNLHLHPMVAALFGKNMLWTYDNLFRTVNGMPLYHDLAASEHGVTKRQQSSTTRGPVSHTRRRWITRDMQNCLSRIGLEGEETLEARVSDVVDMTAVVGGEGHESKRQKILNKLYDDYVEINGAIGKMVQTKLLAVCDQRRDDDRARQMEGEKGDNIRAAEKAMDTL